MEEDKPCTVQPSRQQLCEKAADKDPQGYENYSDQQLIEKEQEDESIQATTDEIRMLKQQDVSKPFTASSHREARDTPLLDTHRLDSAERDGLSASAQAWARKDHDDNAQSAARHDSNAQENGRDLVDRANYQFETGSKDSDMEDQVDSKSEELRNAFERLKRMGIAMEEEARAQERYFGRGNKKRDGVEDKIVLNKSRLARIR
jgi:hypothetical protein